MRHYDLALVGFGNVGRALARLLKRKEAALRDQYGLTCTVTGIYTGRHGAAINPQGVDLEAALQLVETGSPLNSLSSLPPPQDVLDFTRRVPAQVLFENSPANYDTGQPALDTITAALERGMHAITANKGPVVHGYIQLQELARQVGCEFMFESTVMDGAPIFSLFREAVPAAELIGFRGILNSSTNIILTSMERGASFDEALAEAQKAGVLEADPSGDIDGWDAAIKVAALVTVLMGVPMLPQQVQRQGIRDLTQDMVKAALQQGKRWKLICTAHRGINGVSASVAPELVSPGSVFYTIDGSSAYIEFETDVLPGLGVVENNPNPETTAYGLLADMLKTLK